jgi:hypothetical protein
MNKSPPIDDTLIERMCRDILTWDFIDIYFDGAICIETHDVVTYKILDKLSKAFKTDSINVRPNIAGGYCTGFTNSCKDCWDLHTVITIKDAKFNIEDIHVCPMQEDSCGECW